MHELAVMPINTLIIITRGPNEQNLVSANTKRTDCNLSGIREEIERNGQPPRPDPGGSAALGLFTLMVAPRW